MMHLLKICLLAAIFLSSTSVWAKKENLYFEVGVGGAGVKYSGRRTLERIKEMQAAPGYDAGIPFAILLGLHVPIMSSTLLGFSFSSTSNSYTSNTLHRLSIVSTVYGLSFTHFLGKEPGSGLFFRGIIGLGYVSLSSGVAFNTNYAGYGASASGGFGIPISDGSRLLLQAGVNTLTVGSGSKGSDSINSVFGTLGILW